MGLTRSFLCSREWRFGRADGGIIAERIRFRRDGIIIGYTHPNEARWWLELGILVFCREDDVATTRFGIDQLEEPASLSGTFLFDENITHILTEVDRVPMPGYVDFKEEMFASTEELRMRPVRPNLGQPLLLSLDDITDFTITFAGISENTPTPSALLNILQAGNPEMELAISQSRTAHPGIWGPLGELSQPIMLRAKEVINIMKYDPVDNHNPPRSKGEHQYKTGFRWEANVAFTVDEKRIPDILENGTPQMFDIQWRYRGSGGTLYHSFYISDIHAKRELKFFHVTDTHTASRNDLIPEVLTETRNRYDRRDVKLRYINFNDNLRAVIKHANKEKVDFLVISGDLIDYFHEGILDHDGGQYWYQDYQAGEPGEFGGWLGFPAQADSNFKKLIDIITGQDGRGEKLNCPVFCIPGNHDYLTMEPPLWLKIKIYIGIIKLQDKITYKPQKYGLTNDEGGEFEFWKRTRGHSLGERCTRIRNGQGFDSVEYSGTGALKFGTPDFTDKGFTMTQYLLDISYDTDFTAQVGPHQLICLNTGEDAGIPTASNFSDPDTWNFSTAEKHYLDNQSHNRGITPSHLAQINMAVQNTQQSDGLALLFLHAPFVHERTPATKWPLDKSAFEGWSTGQLPDDTGSYYKEEMRLKNAINGLDGSIAEWDSRCPGTMVEWIENGAGGVDVIFCGHRHNINAYRLDNGTQVSTGEYAEALSSAYDKKEWLANYHPLQFLSGTLKGSKTEFRYVTLIDNMIRSLSMSRISRFDKIDARSFCYLFCNLSIDLARFDGYMNPARNDMEPATHLDWAIAANHNGMARNEIMWDLMEKYGLQLDNISYLQEVANDTSLLNDDLQQKLDQIDNAIAEAIPVYRRIIGGLLPTPDYWIDKSSMQAIYWRLRVFYALSAVSLNIFGVNFGSEEKNSLDLEVHYNWCNYPFTKSREKIKDALEERIGKLAEFVKANPLNMLAMWFAAESVYLSTWAAWNDNPIRGSRDPAVHLGWALNQNRETILNDLCEKYEIAARYQYYYLSEEGLKEFYIYHSMRLAKWGGTVGTLNEEPIAIYFEAESARLRAISGSIAAWKELIISDLSERVWNTGFPLCTEIFTTFAGSLYTFDFSIKGWPRQKYISDLEIDASRLPSGIEIELRILKRLAENTTIENLSKTEESNRYIHYKSTTTEQPVRIQNISLEPSHLSLAMLYIRIPDTAPNGEYTISMIQKIDDREMRKKIKIIQIGTANYIGNRNSKELHKPDCIWTQKMSDSNKIAFSDVDTAIKEGYNGCYYCLKDFDTG